MLSKAPPSIDRLLYPIPFDGPAATIPGKDVVGSKAHNLMRMAASGLPVPPGFVISTDFHRRFLADCDDALDALGPAMERELERLANMTGRRFGDARKPLLLSVRSGAAVSMPGMMETVLNVGLNTAAQSGIVRMTGNPRLARDCRRRLVQQFGEVVHGVPAARFDDKVTEALRIAGVRSIEELSTFDLKGLSSVFEDLYEAEVGRPFPEDVGAQLRATVQAVLASWSSERARCYRELNKIPHTLGTAVTLQTMVFGNIGPTSGAGVAFTRDPATGSNEFYIDFLANAQGEDVVAGRQRASGLEELKRRTPGAYRALLSAKDVLEREFRDMQDFEFTVEEGQLHLLQSRAGKRTPLAALRIARDLVAAALAMLTNVNIDDIEETRFQVPGGIAPIAVGTSAGLGVAVGRAVFDPDRVEVQSSGRHAVILVRPAAETADLAALSAAAGILTASGARTSHAAVVARQLGKPCIVACNGLSIDPSGRNAVIGAEQVAEGDLISIDATTGFVFKGQLEIVRRSPLELLAEVRGWQTATPSPKRAAKPKRSIN